MPSESGDPDAVVSSAPPRSTSDVGNTVESGKGRSGEFQVAADFARLLSAPLTPDELGWLAQYRVLKVLGQGGMGIVFQAEDSHLQRQVALKVMLPEIAANPAARERFLREARAGAALKNDHVVVVYQVGQDRDVPFLSMELLQGQSLEARLSHPDPLPLSEVLRIGRETAIGLAAAHAQGMIHRDIKPANIWLEGPNPRVKLLDFGLARAVGAHSNLTQTGNITGTPEYMSPEQARGQDLDVRSDLFSLGSVLYLMCTGQKPFQGNSVMALLTALAVDVPKSILELNPKMPAALADLVKRLLEKDPAHRPASAREVQQALEAIAAGQAISLPPTHLSGMSAAPPAAPTRSGPRRSRWLLAGGGLAGLALIALVAVLSGWFKPGSRNSAVGAPVGEPIRVGILHALSGTIANDGRTLFDATLLAIDEVNAKGGLLGRPVEGVARDTQSDPDLAARAAEKLILEDKVCTIFGIWTSAARKTVKPVIEKHDHLLVYPVQYEGMEQSPNIVYNGTTPNQQIIPAVRYCFGFLNKRRFFLVGSDYIFPRAANAVIRDELKILGGQIVGETYLPLGSGEVAEVIGKIVASKPDMILNTINGDSNRSLIRGLRAAGVKSDRIPTVYFSLSEQEIRALPSKEISGDYAAWSYFQSIERPENQAFVKRFQARYGAQRVVSDPMEAAYAGVHLWAQAVQAAGADDVRAIRQAIRDQRYEAPEGPIRIDPETQHTWKTVRLGKIGEAGQLEIVWSSEKAIRPEVYPATRTAPEWNAFLQDLYTKWGNRWTAPQGEPDKAKSADP
jgi:urea ABC transporter urea binding protein